MVLVSSLIVLVLLGAGFGLGKDDGPSHWLHRLGVVRDVGPKVGQLGCRILGVYLLSSGWVLWLGASVCIFSLGQAKKFWA